MTETGKVTEEHVRRAAETLALTRAAQVLAHRARPFPLLLWIAAHVCKREAGRS